MNYPDAGNPYRAPDASLDGFPDEIRRPPVYTAISTFCWIIGPSCLAASVLFATLQAMNVARFGWRRVFFAGYGPRIMLITALGLLGAILYLNAGRMLRADRGKPGLACCSLAVALTYLAAWLMTWR